jgi:hypothetical protein
MTGAWRSGAVRRGVALTLILLALVLKVVVPPGFMVADPGASFPITICTGHGPLVLDPGDTRAPNAPTHNKGPTHKMDTPCTGAGNITPPAPPLVAGLAEPYVGVAQPPGAGPNFAVAPGRGLAAPPPPSHAPPAFS